MSQEYPRKRVGEEFYPYRLSRSAPESPHQIMPPDIFSRVLLVAPALPSLLIVTRIYFAGVGTSYQEWRVGVRADSRYLQENRIDVKQLERLGDLTVQITVASGTYKGFPVVERESLEFRHFVPLNRSNPKPIPTVDPKNEEEINNLKEKFILEL